MLYGIWSKIKELISRLNGDTEITNEEKRKWPYVDENAKYTRIEHCDSGMFDDSGLTVKEVESCWRDDCCNTELSEKDTNENALTTESFAMPTSSWDELTNDPIEENELVVNAKPSKKKSAKKKTAKKATKSEKKVAKEKAVKKSKKNKKN